MRKESLQVVGKTTEDEKKLPKEFQSKYPATASTPSFPGENLGLKIWICLQFLIQVQFKRCVSDTLGRNARTFLGIEQTSLIAVCLFPLTPFSTAESDPSEICSH